MIINQQRPKEYRILSAKTAHHRITVKYRDANGKWKKCFTLAHDKMDFAEEWVKSQAEKQGE